MSKTVIGFFNTQYDAQRAIERLTEKGFSRQAIDISQGQRQESADHQPNQVTAFFNRLFGTDSEDARRYARMGNQEVRILTVHAGDAELAERAADILDDCGAMDVSEQERSTVDKEIREYPDERSVQTNAGYANRPMGGSEDRHIVSGASRSAGSDQPMRFKGTGSADQDRQNLATGHDYTGSAASDPTSSPETSEYQNGPGASGANSEYVDERSFPVDRFKAGSEDNSDLPTRNTGSNDDLRSRGHGITGEDMTNDGISSPDDDQRVINQNHPGRSTLSSSTENTGLETSVPSPQEQLERAKRRSRIIDSRLDDDYRLRD